MKTYPIYSENGQLKGFEITSAWIRFGPLLRILRSVDGVTEVSRQWFNDERVSFKFHGRNAVINEPWGDNSRYWIGLEKADEDQEIDISPIHEAFRKYRGLTVF
jgi:hypothetical protein